MEADAGGAHALNCSHAQRGDMKQAFGNILGSGAQNLCRNNVTYAALFPFYAIVLIVDMA